MRVNSTKKPILLGSTLLAGAMLAGAAWAQSASAGGANEVGELVVTGTRIPRPNLEQPTPVSVLTPAMIQNAGPQNLGDIISQLPSVGYTGGIRANANNFGNGAGISSIDLRNLGLSRTLVLVDGQRHVNGDISNNAVDISSIPTALVDHVEIVTGGASAIYGSDAVSGVVNIILKKKFEGFQGEVQGGGYDNGFGTKFGASATAGRNFLNDKLNVVVTGFLNKEYGVNARDLPAAHNYGRINNPDDLPAGTFDPTFYSSGAPIKNDGKPDTLYVPNVGSEFVTANGVLLNAASFLPQFSFDKAGRLIPVPVRTGYNSFAFGALPANCQDCYYPEDYTQLVSPTKAWGGNLRANYDVTDRLHAYVDAKFVQTRTDNLIQPSFSFGDFQLQPDNAFIAPDLQAALAGTAPGDYPFIAKFLNGARTQEARRRTYRVVAGVNGEFDAKVSDVKWDASINYGETDARFINNSLEITQNFAAALDSVIDPSTGQAACRINVPTAPQTGNGSGAFNKGSCVPYNPFGAPSNPAALAYAFGNFATRDKLTQQVANLNLSFDSGRFLKLQGGPIGFAVGGEYRMERTKERNDPFLNAGNTENLSADSAGGYNVKEAYAEVSAPIFKDFAPLLSELTLDAAIRYADYSTVGGATAYKFSGTYGPVSWIKLRATYSRAIRAPNITEAFLPQTPGFFNITDPCSQENIQNNINYAANCARAGLPAGFQANTNASIQGQTKGNAALSPEKSISYTGGVIIEPPFVPGLSVSLDYYSIKIKNAISLVQAQDVINNCFGSAAGLDTNFCSLLTRGANQNINFVNTTYVNASKLYTEGYELHASYAADVAPLTGMWSLTKPLDGRLSFELTADYLTKLRNFPFQNDPTNVHILEGVVSSNLNEGSPHLKGLADVTYKQGPISLTWQTRYVGKGALFNRDPTAADQSESRAPAFAESTFYHNLSFRYEIGRVFEGAEVFGGVNNIFDEEPPFTTIGTGQDVAYDLGRFGFIGVRVRR
ncbi:TonB-dependent receptor [Phenylobacterium sp.]|uniref:TonB-dependent receptor plug domain-containing protein n=1 Tax=Phenylobacterium sp. TaxID=1871053 RepID=UPI0025EEB306|nr:TonB-dependent receptor [Phenylobacterium sp.]